MISLPEARWGEKPQALVVKRAEAQVGEKQLMQHIRGFVNKGIISMQVVLLKVHFVDAIDKTSVGKINKRLLREKYQG